LLSLSASAESAALCGCILSPNDDDGGDVTLFDLVEFIATGRQPLKHIAVKHLRESLFEAASHAAGV
jgi:hypothetical protein